MFPPIIPARTAGEILEDVFWTNLEVLDASVWKDTVVVNRGVEVGVGKVIRSFL
jgi:hypothetical protein